MIRGLVWNTEKKMLEILLLPCLFKSHRLHNEKVELLSVACHI